MWNVTQSWNAGNSCDQGVEVDTYSFIKTQNGCNLTINVEGSIDYATINGNTSSYTYTESWFEPDVGNLNIAELITITVSGNSFRGSSTWTISGDISYTGISQYSGVRQQQPKKQ